MRAQILADASRCTGVHSVMVQLDNLPLERSLQRAIRHARTVLSPEDLDRLYWLSGSTCAGKSTISTEIANTLQWAVYTPRSLNYRFWQFPSSRGI